MAEHRFIKACRGEPTDCTPVWFMRQAGRYMAEYRTIRKSRTFMEVATNPDLTAEVTLQPIKAFPLDAAIIFADIMTPLEGIGIDFSIEPGVGPVIPDPIQTVEQVEALSDFDPSAVDYLGEAIRKVVQELDGEVPLIGFAGAPFTLAGYIIQGRSSKNFAEARTLMRNQPEVWNGLMARLSAMVVEYLKLQVKAGAQCVQVFDSWVGWLSPADYVHFVQPWMKKIFDGLNDVGVPTIHFGTGTATLLELMRDAGGDVMGLDWRVGLDDGWQRVGYDKAVQGNLDPTVLLAKQDVIHAEMARILDEAGGRPGHIFNLGHGILRTTDPENVKFLANAVHEYTERT